MTANGCTVHNGHGHENEKTSEASIGVPEHGGDVQQSDHDNKRAKTPDEEPKRTVTGLKVFSLNKYCLGGNR
jgi:hypothetical protein